mmetsp:Transcript_27696/g.85818  ORF Transcript_27696/g.85818 Transcript_27696/m.85818 type:complete len:264 (+) Transcript_27696:1519-2310(+)
MPPRTSPMRKVQRASPPRHASLCSSAAVRAAMAAAEAFCGTVGTSIPPRRYTLRALLNSPRNSSCCAHSFDSSGTWSGASFSASCRAWSQCIRSRRISSASIGCDERRKKFCASSNSWNMSEMWPRRTLRSAMWRIRSRHCTIVGFTSWRYTRMASSMSSTCSAAVAMRCSCSGVFAMAKASCTRFISSSRWKLSASPGAWYCSGWCVFSGTGASAPVGIWHIATPRNRSTGRKPYGRAVVHRSVESRFCTARAVGPQRELGV